jgi:hypothetical protein
MPVSTLRALSAGQVEDLEAALDTAKSVIAHLARGA